MKCFLVVSLVLAVCGQRDASALLKGKSHISEIELETAESGYAPVAVYDDHGLSAYGKKAEDYGSYGHADKGYKDYYGDTGYGNHGLNKYSDYQNSDHYGAKSGSQGHNYGQGLWQRNRGYGYEKHYAYDKELSTNKHGGAHSDHDSHYGAHDQSGHKALQSHDKYGHNKYNGKTGHESNDYGKYGHLVDNYGKKSYGHSAHTQVPVPTYIASAPPAYHAPPAHQQVYVAAPAPAPALPAHIYAAPAPQAAITTVYHTKSVPQYSPALPAPTHYQTIGDAYSSGHGITYY